MSESAIEHQSEQSDKDDEDDEGDFYIDSDISDEDSTDEEQTSNYFSDAVIELPVPFALKQFILYYRKRSLMFPEWNWIDC